MQQGGVPSPFDRNYGTKMAAKCVDWFQQMIEKYTDHKGQNKGCHFALYLLRKWFCSQFANFKSKANWWVFSPDVTD